MKTPDPSSESTITSPTPAPSALPPQAYLGSCAACRTPVQVVPTPHGVLMPLEIDPHVVGQVVVTAAGVALPLTVAQARRWSGPRWRSHYETCPRAAFVAERVGCTRAGCDVALALGLLLVGEASHPTCQPVGADRGRVAGLVNRRRPGSSPDLVPALVGIPTQSATQPTLIGETA